jgi:hypothetical protein
MEENSFDVATHPPYSSYLAPSDFYLFGALKSRMKGPEFNDGDEILEWIIDEMQQISSDEFRRVFDHWRERRAAMNDTQGNYIL